MATDHRAASTRRRRPGCSTPRTRRSAGSPVDRLGLDGRRRRRRPPIADEPWVRTLLDEPAGDGPRQAAPPVPKWGGVHWRLAVLARARTWIRPTTRRSPRCRRGRVRAGRRVAERDVAAPRDARARRPGPDVRVAWTGSRPLGGDPPGPGGGPACRRDRARASPPGSGPTAAGTATSGREAAHSSFNESLAPLRALAAYAAPAPTADVLAAAATRRGERAADVLPRAPRRTGRTGPGSSRTRRSDGPRAGRPTGTTTASRGCGCCARPAAAAIRGRARPAESLRAAAGADGRWAPDRRLWKGPGTAGSDVEYVDWAARGRAADADACSPLEVLRRPG